MAVTHSRILLSDLSVEEQIRARKVQEALPDQVFWEDLWEVGLVWKAIGFDADWNERRIMIPGTEGTVSFEEALRGAERALELRESLAAELSPVELWRREWEERRLSRGLGEPW